MRSNLVQGEMKRQNQKRPLFLSTRNDDARSLGIDFRVAILVCGVVLE